MESPSRTLTLSPPPPPHHLPTTTRRRRSSGANSANSTDFEFSNTGSNSQTTLHTADELFSHGFLLPLQLLHLNRSDHFTPEPDTGPHEYEPGSVEPDPHPSPLITSSGSISKRWRDIFKRPEKKPDNISKPEKAKEKGKINNNNNNNNTELNINIWPFSRSRSAGNSNKVGVQLNRKVSSAPCSRSNSSGESKSSRKSWPSSPGRPGVHLGRSSPVWHIKKSGPNRGGSGNKGRVLRLNVPVCIGYRQNLSCRSDESGGCNGGGGFKSGGYSGGDRVDSGNNGNLFSLRGLFSRKSSSTSTELTV